MIQTKTEKEENIFLSGENKSSGYLGTSLDVSFGHRFYSFIFVLFPFIIFLLFPPCASAMYLISLLTDSFLKANGTNIYVFIKSGTFEVTRRRSRFLKL
jgi:hypothetical protein